MTDEVVLEKETEKGLIEGIGQTEKEKGIEIIETEIGIEIGKGKFNILLLFVSTC